MLRLTPLILLTCSLLECSGKIDSVSKALRLAEETIDGVDERQRIVKDRINSYVDEVRPQLHIIQVVSLQPMLYPHSDALLVSSLEDEVV